jgi:hypothetical protein
MKTLQRHEYLLSIVVTIYRPSRGLQNLKSWIFDESLSSYQVIVIHDKSDNESIDELVDSLDGKSNFVFIEDFFGSPGRSRNAGIENASGMWITFWDFDDLPRLIQFNEFIRVLTKGTSTVGIGSFEVVNTSDRKLISRKVFPSEVVSECLPLTFINPGLWRWVFRSEAVGEMRFKSHAMGEDQLFLAEIQAHNHEIAISQSVIYSYFVGDSLQQTAIQENYIDVIQVIHALGEEKKHMKGPSREFVSIAILALCSKLLEGKNKSRTIRRIMSFVICKKVNLVEWLFKSIKLRHYIKASLLQDEDPERKKAVYFFGGLGNQMFQLAFALSLSKAYSVKIFNPSDSILKIIMEIEKLRFEKQIYGNGFEIVQDINQREKIGRNVLIRLGSKLGWMPKFLNRIVRVFGELMVHFSEKSQFKKIMTLGIGYDKTLVPRLISANVAVVGYLQTFVWADSVRNVMESAIANIIKDNYQLNNLAQRVRIEKPIFLQYRLGDYYKNSKIGWLDGAYFKKEIARLDQESPNRKIWLFSDEPNLALHYLGNDLAKRIEIVNEEFSDLETLALLAQGETFIISNSTFGWWGAYLAHSTRCIVPHPWFARLAEPFKLIPSDWEKGVRREKQAKI